ncbi:glycosyltransferase family 4 protein [Bariatricus massiliensis]|uniref:glycosyltransferase family 4 protein n=1 Tax=Bariatricus massiliensis TaxID=1745713 RepID=UPI001FA729BA|nr:glycosyltransferase family 4 protein [Bariatricus massiliensis]
MIPHDKNHAMAACNFVTCKMADHIILRNKKYKKVLAEKYRLPEREITCLELWRHFPPEMCSPHSGKFLCFGRIRKYKGFDLLEGIIGRTPQIQYQVVGEPDEESIAIVNKLKKYPNVFVDDREVSDKEMENYFKGADWVVLPYASATQSGVIVDACKYSRPVIAFNVGAISEQVKEGETGFLVPQKDVKGFANVISKVNKFSAEELDDFSHNAYMFGYQKYAAEAVAECFLSTILSTKY